MWERRLGLLMALAGALTAGGCMRSTQSYLVYDPNTGQHYTTTALPQSYTQPSYTQSSSAPPSHGQQQAQGFELSGLRAGLSATLCPGRAAGAGRVAVFVRTAGREPRPVHVT
jgi:hypothetical protein